MHALRDFIGLPFRRTGSFGKLRAGRGLHKALGSGRTIHMTRPDGRSVLPCGAARLAAATLLAGMWLALAMPGAPAQAQEAGQAGGEDVPGESAGEGQPAGSDAPRPGDGGATMASEAGVPAAVPGSRDPNRGQVTNLPVPRYVSLKGSEGNARRGPSLSHRIDWVFRHAGMPLRVTAEYGHWRRVEDADGAGGWVHYALLSGVRTAIIQQDMAELRARPNADAAVTARAEQGAIVKLGACRVDWCQITGGGTSGWVPQSALWGVDRGEVRD